MAQRAENAGIYAAGVIQGVVLVTFPAIGAIFTGAAHYGFSATEYGGMFIPQAVAAVIGSLAGAGLARIIGAKGVLMTGLAADLLSMLLLMASSIFMARHAAAYALLLAATGCLGVGFGFAVPALNTFTAKFHPSNVDSATLTLNALLGLGTALAPLFAMLFVGFGIWWGLPILMSALTFTLLLYILRLPLRIEDSHVRQAGQGSGNIPPRFWLFACFALLYGVCETMNANWATIYMADSIGASAALASLALTLFWLTVTGGRIFFALIERFLPEKMTYRLLPFIVGAAFLMTAAKGHLLLTLVSFAIAGLGCSALLPLTISFGEQQLPDMSASLAGGLIGFYQIGYGIAAFGVGPLENFGKIALSAIYSRTAAIAMLLGAIAWRITARTESRKGAG